MLFLVASRSLFTPVTSPFSRLTSSAFALPASSAFTEAEERDTAQYCHGQPHPTGCAGCVRDGRILEVAHKLLFLLLAYALWTGSVHTRRQRPKVLGMSTKACKICGLRGSKCAIKVNSISTSTSKDYVLHPANVNFAFGQRLWVRP